MPAQNATVTTIPVFLGVGDEARMTVRSLGTGIVYYANQASVSASSNLGSIAAGASATIAAGQWFVASASTNIVLSPVVEEVDPTLRAASQSRQRIVFKSRGQVILAGGGSGLYDAVIAAEHIFRDVDGTYYLIYTGTGTNGQRPCLASAPAVTGAYTDLGAFSSAITSGDAAMVIKYGAAYYLFNGSGATSGFIHTWKSTTGLRGTYTDIGANGQIPCGTGGSFDENRTSEPHVFQDRTGQWRMFYMGFDAGNAHEQIGMATAPSIEGPWTKYGSNPVIAANQVYDAKIAADPFVFYTAGRYWIGYVAGGAEAAIGENHYRTCFATTTDFVTFTKQGVFSEPPALPSPMASKQWRGHYYWDSDGLIYWPTVAADTRAAASLSAYLDVIDPVCFADGPREDPWITVDANAADGRRVETGTWVTSTSGGFLGGNAKASTVAASKQAFHFEGIACRVLIARAESAGIMNIYLDGVAVCPLLDTYNVGLGFSLVLGYENLALHPGAHILEVECTATKNAASSGVTIWVDRFMYIPSIGLPV